MARDAIAFFNTLTCVAERDASGGSEPYIWPALILIDDSTLGTRDLVRATTPRPVFAREIIQGSMRAGETATVPGSMRLQLRLEDNQAIQSLIVLVALLEADETPDKAVEAGFRAYGPALQSTLGSRLLELNEARLNENQARFDEIISEITAAVEASVKSATSDALSASQKVRVLLGTLNLDDSVGSARAFYDTIQNEEFVLTFQELNNNVIVNHYDLAGVLQIRPVPVETCPAEVEAVEQARAQVEAVQGMIELAQEELRSAPPSHKPFWVAEIRRLKRAELPLAEAELDAAKRALAECRARPPRPPRAERPEIPSEIVPI